MADFLLWKGDPHKRTRGEEDTAALLVAKLHKLHDRVDRGREDRPHDKDAADVIRPMQATAPTEMAATLAILAKDEIAGPTTLDAIGYLENLFGRRGRPGIDVAAEALRITMPKDRVSALRVAYAEAILVSLNELSQERI